MPRPRLVPLLLLAVIPLLVFEIHGQLGQRNARVAEARQESLRLLDLVVSEQQRLVEDVQHILSTVASVGGAELVDGNCQNAFERMDAHLPDYLIIQYADPRGVVRCSTDRRAVGAWIGDRANMRRALAAGAFALGGYSIAQGIGHAILTFALPHTGPDGAVAGVLTALLDVRWLKDYLARKPMPPGAAIVMADRDGTILARVPEMPGLSGQPLAERYRFMLAGTQRGVGDVVGFDGVERFIAYSPVGVDAPDLMIWVGLSKEHALQPVETAMWRSLGAFGALLGLVVVVVALGVRHAARLREQTVRVALKMATVLESTTDAVLELDPEWRVTFMNERARSLARDRPGAVGRVLWEVFPELVGTELEARLREGMAAACEFDTAGPLSGRWYHARAFPSKAGMAVFFQDQTEHRRGEEERERLTRELETERILLKGVLAHLPSGVFAVAPPEGRLLLHNAAAERLIGHPVYHAGSVRDYDRHGAVHPDGTPYRAEDYPLARALLRGESVAQEEMLYRRGDGRLTTFAVSAAPVKDHRGRTVMAVSTFHDISERKEAEEALRRSEERLNFALASANAGIWDWEVPTGGLSWSAGMYALHGLSPDRFTPTYEAWLPFVHPDDRDQVQRAVLTILASQDSAYRVEHRIRHPERGERWLMGIGRVVRDANGAPLRLTGISLDVTESKRMHEALRRSEEKLSLALASAQAGTFDWDVATGRIIWSPESYRIFGLDPEGDAPTTQTWLGAVHPEDREALLAYRAASIAERRADLRSEYRIVRPDGAVRWVMAMGRATYAEDGTPLRVVGLDIDITERKRMEEDLLAAKQEAERANLAKSRFLAAASHDLRQPLQSLFLFASALQGQVPTERGKRALDTLERNIEALKGLLDTLLDVSQFDAGLIRPNLETILVGPVLDHIGASFAPIARNKGLDFKVETPPGVAVRSDQHLLGRMIRNLVENAIKYTEQGSVRLSCRVVGGSARIEVHDTGVGIPTGQRDLIFVEFHQVGNPGRDRARGLGLGLSIVRRLSALLEHPVSVHSAPRGGSVFAVEVPLGNAAAVAAPEAETAPVADGAGRLAVLIDDDADVLLGLEGVFRAWGYEALAARSAEEALERLRADGRTPAVVVSDYRLGGNRTGMDAVRLIREHADAAVPGVILTGETRPELHSAVTEQGLGMVVKPVSPRHLHDALRRCLGEAA